MTAPLGTLDAMIERLLDDALERRLRPVLAELAELRGALCTASAPEDAQAFLTPGEAARLLKLKPQTVNRWIRSGKLEAVGPPRARRVKRSAVERFMAQGVTQDGQPDLDSLVDDSLKRRYRR